MRVFLGIWGGLALLLGLYVTTSLKGGIAEVEGLILILTGAVAFGAMAATDAAVHVRDEARKQTRLLEEIAAIGRLDRKDRLGITEAGEPLDVAASIAGAKK